MIIKDLLLVDKLEGDAGSDIEEEPRSAIILCNILEACLDEARVLVNIGWAEVDVYIHKEENVDDYLQLKETWRIHIYKGCPDRKERGCVDEEDHDDYIPETSKLRVREDNESQSFLVCISLLLARVIVNVPSCPKDQYIAMDFTEFT